MFKQCHTINESCKRIKSGILEEPVNAVSDISAFFLYRCDAAIANVNEDSGLDLLPFSVKLQAV